VAETADDVQQSPRLISSRHRSAGASSCNSMYCSVRILIIDKISEIMSAMFDARIHFNSIKKLDVISSNAIRRRGGSILYKNKNIVTVARSNGMGQRAVHKMTRKRT